MSEGLASVFPFPPPIGFDILQATILVFSLGLMNNIETQHFNQEELPTNMVVLQNISPENVNEDYPFAVIPSGGFQQGMKEGVVVHKDVIGALVMAQNHLAQSSPDLVIVLKRGFFPRDFPVRLKERIGIGLFRLLYPARRDEAGEIFSNKDWGHHNGRGVDLGLYDKSTQTYHSTFLPKINAFSSREALRRFWQDNPELKKHYSALCEAVEKAGFTIHKNEVESRQMHVLLKQDDKI